MVFTRTRSRQVVPHVLAAWVVAFVLSFAHACLVHGHHADDPPGAATFAHSQGDSSFPSDCERFCNDDTPVSGDNATSDPPTSSFGGFPVALFAGDLGHWIGGVPGRLGQTEAVAASHTPVLRRSQRLAL